MNDSEFKAFVTGALSQVATVATSIDQRLAYLCEQTRQINEKLGYQPQDESSQFQWEGMLTGMFGIPTARLQFPSSPYEAQ